MKGKDAPSQDEVNLYLDKLRESGVTNMFGAAPHVRRKFGVGIEAARDMLTVWMRTFSERHQKVAK